MLELQGKNEQEKNKNVLHDVIKYYVTRNADDSKNFARFQSLLSFIYGTSVEC